MIAWAVGAIAWVIAWVAWMTEESTEKWSAPPARRRCARRRCGARDCMGERSQRYESPRAWPSERERVCREGG